MAYKVHCYIYPTSLIYKIIQTDGKSRDVISSSSSNVDQSQPKFTSSGNSKAGAVSDGCYQDQIQIASSENDTSINKVVFDTEGRDLHQLSPSKDGRSVNARAHEDVHDHFQLTQSKSKNTDDSDLSHQSSAKESQSNAYAGNTYHGEANIIQQSIHQRSDSEGVDNQRGILHYSAYIPMYQWEVQNAKFTTSDLKLYNLCYSQNILCIAI